MPDFYCTIPLALYVHVPWCVRKCPYCDFNSHEARGPLPERAYIDALLADVEQDLPRVWGRRIDSVFIGGGTPSLLSAEALDRLLSGLRARLPLRPDLEITLEANPGAVEQAQFAEFRAAGISRLSIGVQSFNDEHLYKLGRIHDRRAAFAAAEAAHAAGLDNFNLDLMFGLPGQTVVEALADIANALALQPAHLSYYQLTIEPNTLFHQSPPTLPNEDVIDAIQERAQAALADLGYPRYEVSAYAPENRRCHWRRRTWQIDGSRRRKNSSTVETQASPGLPGAGGNSDQYWRRCADSGCRFAGRIPDERLAAGRWRTGEVVRGTHRFTTDRPGTGVKPGQGARLVGKRSRPVATHRNRTTVSERPATRIYVAADFEEN